MVTPTPPSSGLNIGTSRLLMTNGLQQAVDSLTTQVNKLLTSVGGLSTSFNNMTSSSNRSGNAGNAWNANSNRPNYSGNGGGGNFGGNRLGSRPNGGGPSFGPTGKLSAGVGAASGVIGTFAGYANKNMSTNMQMDFFGIQSAVAGGFTGGPQGPSQTARALAFNNNNVALNATDAARAGYINQYTFGNAQFNGRTNPAFVSGMRQANAFGYASPTLGASGAATAAQQTFSARATMVAPALGLASPILAGGQKNTMGNIAQSIYQRTFGNQRINQQQFDASVKQGGSLAVNLQYFGQALGWNQNTITEYQNYLRGQVAFENRGGTASGYDQLTRQAAAGNKGAVSQLAKTTGLGASMFENQRNLNATRLTRQNDILNSLAPAFDNATKAVNQFSGALTTFLQSTGLNKVVGTGSGWAAPFSGAMGGFSGAFGAGAGVFGAARLFGAARTLTGGRTPGVVGGLGVARTLGSAVRGGIGPLGIVTAAGTAGWGLSKLGKHDATGHSTKGESLTQWTKDTFSLSGIANTLNPVKHLPSIFGGGDAPSGGGGGSYKASNTNNGANAAQVIKFAEQQLGDPYVWGGTGPNGWDCSGLTQWAYGKAGVKIPRVAADQQKQGKPIPTDRVQPGDLLFNGNPAHHVVMAVGGGKIIEAPRTGLNVRIRSFSPGEFTDARRILGAIGDMSSLTNGGSGQNVNTLNQQQSTVGGDIGGVYGGVSELEAIMGALSGGTVSPGALPLSASSGTTGSTSGNQSPTGNVKGTGSNRTSSLQSYAKKLLGTYGWSGQWNSFNALEMSEAGWNPTATNPDSGAYGLAQALPKGKYASAGSDWKTNGETQLRWMMGYIKDRYGSPSNAWSFHQRNNWYAQGAWSIDKDQKATVHQGEMIIPAQQAETIRQTLLNNTFNPNISRSSHSGITFGDINVNLPASYSGTKQEAQMTGKMIVDAMSEELRIKNIQVGQ